MKDYAAALADFSKAIDLQPEDGYNYYWRGRTYREMKDYAAALVDFSKGIDLQPRNAYGYAARGRTYLGLNNASNVQADFAQVEALLGEEGGPAYDVASGYAALSQMTEACIWLRRAFERDGELVSEALTDADFDPIRETAEFKALMAEFEGKAKK